MGATATTGTITRTGDTSNALTVNLISSDMSKVTVPPTVTIPINKDSIDFNITAIDDTIVDGTQTITLTATATNYTEGTVIINVTDNDKIPLTPGMDLTELLPVLPISTDCATLLTQVKPVDLTKDVLGHGKSILAAINHLPYFRDNNWVIVQNNNCGSLQLTIDTVRFAVQPLSVTSTDNPANFEVLEQQSVRFTTETGVTILAHPAVQAPKVLQIALAESGLPNVILQTNGNLRIYDVDYSWFSVRSDWASTEPNDKAETTPGLSVMESPHIKGIFIAYIIFTDNNGKLRQQFFYPALAQPEAFYSQATNVVTEPNGLISFKLGKQNYHGMLSYLINKGTPLPKNQIQIESIFDVNGDEQKDWVLIYPNGERQTLFQKEPVLP